MKALLSAALLATLLAGCAAPPPVAPPATPTVTNTPAPPTDAAGAPIRPTRGFVWSTQMDDTARRLRGSLSGNAQVAQTTDQRLWVSLPSSETFAAGRSALTTSGGAWLDRVAGALRENRRAEIQIVGSPDAVLRGNAAETQAMDRAASARDWMVARGIAPPRMSVAGVAARAAATLPPEGGRLDILIGERADAPK
jgi:outer membrane protein OmpA-like peptidoglycan-associated protein